MKQETEIFKTAVPLLLDWYRLHKRDLPWRHGRTFYTCLVSELMLQQTRVEAVKERYVRFLNRFPTAEALAAADGEEVLKEWEGLGYYSRARNLHAAARYIAEHGVPATFEEVRALPGVGDYTAGAICSVALGLKTPAVDGNVVRVLSRLFADGSVADDSVKKRYSELVKEAFPRETGDFTEALMELGAVVCLPNGAPLCNGCPWETLCRAHSLLKEEEFPVRPEKRTRRREKLFVCVLRFGEEYALKKRGKGLLAGLWEFPNFNELPDFGNVVETKRAKHVFTHIEWEMTGCLIEARERFPEFVWATAEEIRRTYAIPSAFSAFSDWIR